MGMQSLRLKLRKRKYKLSLGRGDQWNRTNDGPTASAFSNAGSEWEFENFSPWIFSSKKPSNHHEAKEELEEEDEEDDEDVKYWGPRPRVQGLVHPTRPSVPLLPPPPTLPAPLPPTTPQPPSQPTQPPPSPPTSPRYGILSYFPRRPSSWSPTSTLPPPIPPHAWQIRRRMTSRSSRPDQSGQSVTSTAAVPSSLSTTSPPPVRPTRLTKNGPTSVSHTDLKRSASCYQGARGTHRTPVSDSLSDLRSPNVDANDSPGWGQRASSRLKRVQSELSCDQPLARPRQPINNSPLESAYCAPYRCRSTNEVRPFRPLRKQSAAASLRHLHNGLASTLASSESHLSGSYTLLNDDIDRTVHSRARFRSSPSPPPTPPHRSPASQRTSPPPPPIPPHAPGILCTRITPTTTVTATTAVAAASASPATTAPVYAVVLRGQARREQERGRNPLPMME